MPWYVYLALKQIFPSGKFSIHTVFYLLSIIGVMMGVFLLVVSQSIMGGFGEMWKEKIIKTTGDIAIRAPRAIYEHQSVIETVEKMPEVHAAAPFAEGIGMLQHYGLPALPAVIGIDIDQGPKVIPINDFLFDSDLEDLDDESVFLSISLARSLRAWIGDVVEFHTPLMLEKLKQDEILMPRELRVAGVYETGWPDFDKNSMLVTLGLMQEFYDLEDSAHSVLIKLEPGINANAVSQQLNATLPKPLAAHTWEERASDFLWVLGFERFMVFILTIPINLVGGFVIVCAQLLSVISKTREIGLIAALGGSPRHLVGGYCFQGFVIGTTGATLGIVLGVTFLTFKDNIVNTMASITGSEQIIRDFYAFSSLPVSYSARDFVVIVISALVLSTLASVIPAFIAARKKPAETLRAE